MWFDFLKGLWAHRLKYKFVTVFLFSSLVFLALPRAPIFDGDYSTVIYDKHDQPLTVFLNKAGQWKYPPQESVRIPKKLKTCVTWYEDRWYDYHPGINPVAILRALWQNILAGRIVSGASTLTMQVVRISNPGRRTWLKKLREAFNALWLEVHFSKDKILKMYLNNAPYGGNIVGYRTATRRYFGKEPKELTWAEAALLAVLPNAPGLLSPGKNSLLLKTKRDRLLFLLKEKGLMHDRDYRLSLQEKVPRKLFPFPRQALHLSMHIKGEHDQEGRMVHTTIDRIVQQRAMEIAKRHNRYFAQAGINNLSLLICDTQSGEVQAYVGSADYFDRAHSGMVDGVRAQRSSGSLLKPFLYALAMDQGILLPDSKLQDIPTYYGPFSPSNADKDFRGLISARDALIFSLNVPAVRLLYRYGQPGFYDDLKQMGLKHLFRSADDYGLPLIIGGAEVTLWEMATLFRGLGRGGRFSPIRYLKDLKQITDKRLLSSGAVYLTLEILKGLKRPGSEYYGQLYQQERPIAWKTGTSYGQRDAWAVGVTPRWTIAVWVGNFNGEGNQQLAGSRSAGPVLFDLFNMLTADRQPGWFKSPEAALRGVTVCAYSGYRATENCTQTIRVQAPVNAAPLQPCPWHQKQFVDNRKPYQVCSLCWRSEHYHTEKCLVLPADVAQFLRNSGKVVPRQLPHNPKCPANHAINSLQITYPTPGAHLWVPRDFDGTYQDVVARAAHRNKSVRIYWYLDGHYLGFTKGKNQMPLTLRVGKHHLVCIDDEGGRTVCVFYSGNK